LKRPRLSGRHVDILGPPADLPDDMARLLARRRITIAIADRYFQFDRPQKLGRIVGHNAPQGRTR